MAAVTALDSIYNTNDGTKTVTATPAVGDLIVVVTGQSGNSTDTAPTDDNADGLGTYTAIQTRSRSSGAARLVLYVRNALVGSATSTIFTHAPGTTTGGGLYVLKVTGMSKTGTAAARGSGGQDNVGSGNTPAPVLTQAGLTNNPVITAVLNGVNPSGVAVPANFTDHGDLGYAVPAAGIRATSQSSGNTAQTITWGGTSGSTFASVAVELNTSRTVAVGQVTETSEVTVLAKQKLRAIGQVAAAETATPLAEVRALGQTVETNLTQPLTRLRVVAVEQALTSSAADTILPRKTRAVGQTIETDAALAVGRQKLHATGQAAATDTARTVTRVKVVAVGRALQANQPRVILVHKTRVVSQVTATDEALGAVARKTGTIGQVIETNEAPALVKQKLRMVEQIATADIAGTVVPERIRPLGQAAETATVNPVTGLDTTVLGQAAAAEAALPVLHLKRLTLGQTIELSEARALLILDVLWRNWQWDVGPATGQWTAGTPQRKWSAAPSEV